MDVNAHQVASAEMSIVVIRANGDVEDLGVVDSYKRPLWRTILHKLGRKS